MVLLNDEGSEVEMTELNEIIQSLTQKGTIKRVTYHRWLAHIHTHKYQMHVQCTHLLICIYVNMIIFRVSLLPDHYLCFIRFFLCRVRNALSIRNGKYNKG